MFDLGDHGKKLLLTAHHLVIDAVSWRIILEDLANLLQQKIDGKGSVYLPLKTNSFQTWSDTLNSFSKLDSIKAEIGYWNMCNGENLENCFSDNSQNSDQYPIRTVESRLSLEETKSLLNANLPYKTQTKDLLLISLGLALNEFTNEQHITIEIEGHGREQISENIDVSRTVGWFTTIHPFHMIIENPKDLNAIIKSMKEQIKEIPDNGIGYGVLRYLSNKVKSQQDNYIRFNYLGEIVQNSENSIFSLSNLNSGVECSISNKPTSLFDIIPILIDEQLKMVISYSPSTVNEQKVKSFIDFYMGWLRKVLDHCLNKNNVEITPSDFDTTSLSQSELDTLFQ